MTIDPTWRSVIVVDPALGLGFLANTVATIGIGLGAALPGLGNTVLTDAHGRSLHNSANRPVPILQGQPDVIVRAILLKAMPTPAEARLVALPRFARSLHAFTDYEAQFPLRLGERSDRGGGSRRPRKADQVANRQSQTSALDFRCR